MKTMELWDIIRIIENFENREKRLSAEYISLNPADKENRERDKQLILSAANMIKTEILNDYYCKRGLIKK